MWQCDVSIAIIQFFTKLRRQRGSSNVNAPDADRSPRSTWLSEKPNVRCGFAETLPYRKYAQHKIDFHQHRATGYMV